MGAAKNARKARRKARLATDRRPYLLDDLAARWVTNNAGTLDLDIGDLVVVTRPDPRNRFSAPRPIGSRIDLTIIQAKRIRKESEGVVTPWEEDRGLAHGALFDGTLKKLLDLKRAGRQSSYFDLPFFAQHERVYGDAPQERDRLEKLKRAGITLSPRARRATGATTTEELDVDHLLHGVDFSAVEKRVMHWMDSADPGLLRQIERVKSTATAAMEKQWLDMRLYGSFNFPTIRQDGKGNTMMDIESYDRDALNFPVRRPEVVRHRMAPPPGTTYLTGKKAGMVILDDVIDEVHVEDGETNDQDLPEVGTVPEDRS